MTPKQFVDKWKVVEVKEISFAQSHFNDICDLVGSPKPLEIDPRGEFFTFEFAAKKFGGRDGRADVWYKNKFIWEYKGGDTDLEEAYEQLQLYRESLGNPPLLIASNAHKIIINTNFTNTVRKRYIFELEDLLDPKKFEVLKNVFFNPDNLKPDTTQEQITIQSADSFINMVKELRQWNEYDKDYSTKEEMGHFIMQLLFCLFAEDIKLLPDRLFCKVVSYDKGMTGEIRDRLQNLFEVMSKGGMYGPYKIPFINGTLFESIKILKSINALSGYLERSSELDWASIDPSIFGTLFERVIDEDKRAQLGAHYTSKYDIALIVDPVIMNDLRNEWIEIKRQATELLQNNKNSEAKEVIEKFSNKVSSIKVLDPACGSGNFLYVTLWRLLDLQKEVIVFAKQKELGDLPLTVSPKQLFGIEIDPYAHQLAQIVIWIGYIQWRNDNGFKEFSEPVLQPLHQILNKDSVLKVDEEGHVTEPEWPETDYIIGNPPFLGNRKMRPLLGDKYVSNLETLYKNDLDGIPDLVCYWFNRAMKLVEQGKVKKVGLLATQAIRGGTNRQVLDRIVKNGEIFMAWSDKEWILDGAKVHVSIVGFDKGGNNEIYLNGNQVKNVNSHLDSQNDLSSARELDENENLSFQGVVLRGKFDLTKNEAEEMLEEKNPSGCNNSDVLKIRKTGADVLSKSEDSYVVDFGIDTSIENAKKYITPFDYVEKNVYTERQNANQKEAQEKWWLHWNPRIEMKKALVKLPRYIATPRVAKHRIFVWLDKNILPDAQLVVFARNDDYFMGVLHSKVHELWARKQGTQLRDAVSGFRYTPKTTFRTFPMPWVPGKEPLEDAKLKEISRISKLLMEFRDKWLHPEGVGITFSDKHYKQRTLTNLYNALDFLRKEIKGRTRDESIWNKQFEKEVISLEDVEELDKIHDQLDISVLDSYGWDKSVGDEEIIDNLLQLNNSRPGKELKGEEPEEE
jgi:hypothetical protein